MIKKNILNYFNKSPRHGQKASPSQIVGFSDWTDEKRAHELPSSSRRNARNEGSAIRLRPAYDPLTTFVRENLICVLSSAAVESSGASQQRVRTSRSPFKNVRGKTRLTTNRIGKGIDDQIDGDFSASDSLILAIWREKRGRPFPERSSKEENVRDNGETFKNDTARIFKLKTQRPRRQRQ